MDKTELNQLMAEACEVSESVVKSYYSRMDNFRIQMMSHFSNSGALIFNGNHVSRKSLSDFFIKDLPKTTHTVHTIDSQIVCNNDKTRNILVTTTGEVEFPETQNINPRKFIQTLLLCSVDSKWKIQLSVVRVHESDTDKSPPAVIQTPKSVDQHIKPSKKVRRQETIKISEVYSMSAANEAKQISKQDEKESIKKKQQKAKETRKTVEEEFEDMFYDPDPEAGPSKQTVSSNVASSSAQTEPEPNAKTSEVQDIPGFCFLTVKKEEIDLD